MKLKIFTLASALLLAYSSYGQITDPAPYCKGGYKDNDHYISNVTLGSLNNTTGDTPFAAPHYAYYNNVTAPDLIAGHTYTLSITHDYYLHFVAAYIDYNQNYSFYDSGEKVLQQKDVWGTPSITYPTSAVSITIPETATPGITRMRVLVFEDDYYTGSGDSEATPCTEDTLEWGETEDYNVNIIPSTGIANITKNNTDLFYPNPANGILYADENLRGAEMIIYNVAGKIMLHSHITDKKIDASNLATGQYYIKTINKNGVYTQPITIIKP